MRDPLKEPKYGDVFEWMNDRPVKPMAMYLCDSLDHPGEWVGLTLVTNTIRQPGEINERWTTFDRGLPPRASHWRVVEATP